MKVFFFCERSWQLSGGKLLRQEFQNTPALSAKSARRSLGSVMWDDFPPGWLKKRVGLVTFEAEKSS